MGIAFLVIGIIAGAIYNAVSNNGNDKKSGWTLIIAFLIVGSILETMFGHFVGVIGLFILFAGWVFH